MVGLKKRSHTQKSHPKVVNPRDTAGELKKKKKKKKKKPSHFCIRWRQTIQKQTFSFRTVLFKNGVTGRLLGISYRDHVTNEKVGNRIRQAIGPYEDLLTTVKKRKLRWYGHKTRSTGLAKMILQGTVQGGRRRGRQKKRWEDNITEWTGLKLGEALRKAENREEWRTVVARSSLVPQRSYRLWDKWSEVKWSDWISLTSQCKSAITVWYPDYFLFIHFFIFASHNRHAWQSKVLCSYAEHAHYHTTDVDGFWSMGVQVLKNHALPVGHVAEATQLW